MSTTRLYATVILTPHSTCIIHKYQHQRHWLKYWVSFGAFQMFEIITDLTISFILPFYIELKILSIVWMVLGTKLIYDTIVHRELSRREKAIDRWLTKISKGRDELLAIVWLEVSQCSIKILSALMSGGLSVLLVKTPESSNRASPVYSDEDDEDKEDKQDDIVMMETETEIEEEPIKDDKPVLSRIRPRLQKV